MSNEMLNGKAEPLGTYSFTSVQLKDRLSPFVLRAVPYKGVVVGRNGR